MRRALFLLLAAVPAFALGQTAPSEGAITFSANTINIAQCQGVQSSDPPVRELQEVTLAFSIKLAGTATFTQGGTFRLWAANRQVQAEQWSGTGTTSCNIAETAGEGFIVREVVDETSIPTESRTATGIVDTGAITTASGFAPDCTGADIQTIHLCVDWTPSGGSPSGWATGTMTFDPTTPGAPSSPRASGGDGSLRVSCTPGTDNDAFIARAMIGTDLGTARYSNQSTSCSELRIAGLQNETDYTVVVFGLNDVGNPSVPSASTTGRPVPTDDFWDEYQDANGAEQGGCNTAAGAAGIFGALSLIAAAAAARRRKP